MANEFIARKGLIVLSNGAKITGSLGVMGDVNATNYNITASNMQLLGSASVNGDLSINGNLTLGNEDMDIVKFLAKVSSSIIPKENNAFDLGSGSKAWRNLYVSGTAYVTTLVAGNIGIEGSTILEELVVTNNTRLGNSAEDTVTVTGSLNVLGQITATSISGAFSGSGAQLTNIPNSGLTNSTIGITAGSGLSGGATVSLGSGTTLTLDTASAHFVSGVKKKLDTDGVVSSSIQIDVRNTTGIVTIATTGSNTFTGVQTISNTTNSTTFADGALIVQGGVGIAKDVNISGSLTVTGLLTAVSMSTQYVTSSQYTVGTSRIILNDDDLVRFAGISVADSGSTAATGSLLWDSLKNHWVYEREDGGAYRSAVLIAGPKNYGTLGDEEELVAGRVPVATGGDHIDTNIASSSIRIIPETLQTHIEHGLYVTGSVTSSVGFSGDGSNLTGIVTNLNITGSQGGTGTISLKTQGLTVSGSNGIAVTANNQTILVSASNATTSSVGVASYNGNNFTVTNGQVSAKVAVVNGVNVELGSSINISLAEITNASATTPDQLSLNGGAVIHGVLYTSGSNNDVDTGTEEIAVIPTGSYNAAHFDYVVKKASNLRTGTVMVVWDSSTGTVEFTDTSTNDIGNTSEVIFTADTLTGNIRLLATVSTTDWAVKTAARLI